MKKLILLIVLAFLFTACSGEEKLIFKEQPGGYDSEWIDTELTTKQFEKAEVEINPFGYESVVVFLTFNEEGAELLEDITSRNVGKPVGIFINGELISAPTVNEPISGGQVQIAGNFTEEEAQALADDLNNSKSWFK